VHGSGMDSDGDRANAGIARADVSVVVPLALLLERKLRRQRSEKESALRRKMLLAHFYECGNQIPQGLITT
jgi:hypothetical protein